MMQSALPILLNRQGTCVSNSIHFETPEKRRNMRSQKFGFDFWNFPKVTPTF